MDSLKNEGEFDWGSRLSRAGKHFGEIKRKPGGTSAQLCSGLKSLAEGRKGQVLEELKQRIVWEQFFKHVSSHLG